MALRQLRRDDRVAVLGDDLSHGPINPPSLRLRNQFLENELGYDFEAWDRGAIAAARGVSR
jgi:hypothetical protein